MVSVDNCAGRLYAIIAVNQIERGRRAECLVAVGDRGCLGRGVGLAGRRSGQAGNTLKVRRRGSGSSLSSALTLTAWTDQQAYRRSGIALSHE